MKASLDDGRHNEYALKSPPWIMKFLMTRWNLELLYPNPGSRGVPSFLTPVDSARKFSTVLGTDWREKLSRIQDHTAERHSHHRRDLLRLRAHMRFGTLEEGGYDTYPDPCPCHHA